MDNKNNTQKYDKKMLKEYLNKFSKEQLKELNRAVRSKDLSFPSIVDEPAKEFFVQNPLYFFDYLDKEVIAKMLCRSINYNVIMAENTAETLYNCGRDEAMQYPNMVLAIQSQLGPNFKVLM